MGEKKLVRKTKPASKHRTRWPRWTGFRGMTFRDWLQLLFVPLLLGFLAVGLTAWFNNQQAVRQQQIENQRAEAERELAEQRAQDEALQSYLDQMGQLLLEEDLRNSQQEDISGTLARARTVTVLRSLDGDGKGSVLQFLYESELITGAEEVQQPEKIEQQIEEYQRFKEFEAEYEKLLEASRNRTFGECYSSSSQQKSMPSPSSENAEKIKDLNQKLDDLSKRFSDNTGPQEFVPLFGPGTRPVEPVVSLLAANLAHAELPDTELRGAYLRKVDLHSATLSRTILDSAILTEAVLDNADLEGTRLLGAHMFLARLRNTNLRGADLRAVQLDGRNLVGANLTHAYLFSGTFRSATLSDANLSRSVLTDADLSCANLKDANLSDADLSPIGPPDYKVPDVNDIKDPSGGEASTTQNNEILGAVDLRETGADLSGADLSGADVSGANFSGTNLRTAKVTNEQLATCKSLEGATMHDGQILKVDTNPDGPTFEEWLKSRGEGDSGS